MKTSLDIGPFVEALASVFDVSAHVRFPHAFDVVAGSLAEAEFAKQSDYAGPWSDEPLAEAVVAGNVLIYGAEDHLRAAGELIAGGESRYGPFTLLRAALEQCAQAWWIFDPAIGLDERLCRGANFILGSYYQQRKLEDEAGLADSRTPKIKEILDTAAQTGLGVTKSKQGSPRWVGHHPPRDATSLCRLAMQDSSGPETYGGVMYRYLSATPHGSLHGLLKASHHIPGMPVGKMGMLRSQDIDINSIAMLAAGVLTAYISAAERQIVYVGWGGPAWDAWKLGIWKRLRPYLPDSPA